MSVNPLRKPLQPPAAWLLLALAVWLAFFWQLGAVPLYDLDEGAFTEATREMLDSGNFITPHRDGEPRYAKPVLIYWLQAASVSALGLNEFALRLPSAIAATLWLVALWGFTRARLDAATATVAALIMAFGLEVPIIGKAAVADAVLNLFIAVAFFDIYRYLEAPRRGLLLRVYLWLGLGFLTKGPVAVFFPLLVSFAYCLSLGRLKDWLGAVFAPAGWLVFLAVAGPWYLAIYIDDGSGFFRSFFLNDNIGRFGGVKHGHSGFPGYYFVMLPLVLLPFTGWFLRLLPLVRRLWSDRLDRFLVLWFVAVFVTFSFSDTKLPHYMVYGITPLFILMARHRQALTNRWLAFGPPLAFMALLVVLPLLLGPLSAQAHRAHEQAMFAEGAQVLDWAYVMTTVAGLAIMVVLAFYGRIALWQRLLLAGAVQTLVVFGALVPRVFEVMQTPVKEAGLLARELDLPTVVYRTSMPSFSVYRDAITPWTSHPEPGELIFLRVDKLDDLAATRRGDKLVEVYRRGPVALATFPESGGD
ncbi:MAG: glycosyltransferase family 39 protein [Thiohalocapsa sp.]|uniref:ArnT family glycosyltransferase n=1 Tax=Thiohalocapsa sp. TaxID=2497641 RepID=UPI0025F63524|nr:glycosyltransferase family 39 protein [Thiohalocapsa sp.]MCG6941242.1 glycosyltransferase family 39 protein [Thiohalocapsa sp.]